MTVIEDKQEPQEQVIYTMGRDGKRYPPLEKFEYRHIMHVGDPGESRDSLIERTMQKFRNIDAGLNPDGSPKVKRQSLGYIAPTDKAGSVTELVKQIEELKALVAAQSQPKAPEPDVSALTAERDALLAKLEADGDGRTQEQIDAVGRGEEEPETVLAYSDEEPAPTPKGGECPGCGKEFRRLDVHLRTNKTCKEAV